MGAADRGATDSMQRMGSGKRGWIVVLVMVVLAVVAIGAGVLLWRGRGEQTGVPGTATGGALATDGAPVAATGLGSDARREERMEMVEHQIRRRGVTDQDVLAAMERVPRHEFVPEDLRRQAYADHPLPIGYGQTISQPYIVALMTELLRLKGERLRRVVEHDRSLAVVLKQLQLKRAAEVARKLGGGG